MRLNTPEGEKQGKYVEFQLEAPEPQFRLLLGTGDTLMCRAVVGAVYAWTDNNGEIQYQVSNSFSVLAEEFMTGTTESVSRSRNL
jgi:hypothetical protein